MWCHRPLWHTCGDSSAQCGCIVVGTLDAQLDDVARLCPIGGDDVMPPAAAMPAWPATGRSALALLLCVGHGGGHPAAGMRCAATTLPPSLLLLPCAGHRGGHARLARAVL